jgi:hypothetical protein
MPNRPPPGGNGRDPTEKAPIKVTTTDNVINFLKHVAAEQTPRPSDRPGVQKEGRRGRGGEES